MLRSYQRLLNLSILAKAPGNEEECKRNLLDAFRELQASPKVVRVVNTYKEVKGSTTKARQAVEQILLLGLMPGHGQIMYDAYKKVDVEATLVKLKGCISGRGDGAGHEFYISEEEVPHIVNPIILDFFIEHFRGSERDRYSGGT